MKFPLMHCYRSGLLPLLAFMLSSLNTVEGAYGDLLWKNETGGILFGAPAIGPNGEVVVGSEDTNVYSYNPDGSLRWIFSEPTDWIDSPPAIAEDGTVYAGSWDNSLYAIDGSTGALKWEFETGGLIIASPVIGPDGTIYIGSNDSFMYALNPDGTEKWASEAVDSYSPINSSAVLNSAGDTLYFGNDSGQLFAVNAANGTKRWSFSIDPENIVDEDAIVGSPAIGSGGDLYFGSENGTLYCLSASGNFRWSFATTETIRSSPAISNNGTLYFAAQDGYLYALDSEGFELWETFVGDVFYCSPALDADGNILICGYDGTAGAASLFTSVNENGEIIWEFLISNYNDSSPNIAPDGSIYFGAHDGALYKFEGAAQLMDGQWPRFQASRRQSGFSPDLNNQELIDIFPSISQSSNGWVQVPWFGSGWITVADMPWIRHEEHGLLYLASTSPGDALYYDLMLSEWVFTSASAKNYYFQYSSSSWLYHVQGSTIYTGRFFYDLNDLKWIGDGL